MTASIQARGIGAGKLTEENWRTDWGSYDRDYLRQQHTEVIITTWGKGEAEATLESVWFGRDLATGNQRVVLNSSSQPVTLKTGAVPKSYLVHSGSVTGNVTKYASLGERYASGHKIEGWYVRLVMNGKTVCDATSATYLADIARDPAKLAAVKTLTPKRSISRPMP